MKSSLCGISTLQSLFKDDPVDFDFTYAVDEPERHEENQNVYLVPEIYREYADREIPGFLQRMRRFPPGGKIYPVSCKAFMRVP